MNKKLELLIAKETQYTVLTTPNTAEGCEYVERFSPPTDFDIQKLDVSKMQEQHYDNFDAERVNTV